MIPPFPIGKLLFAFIELEVDPTKSVRFPKKRMQLAAAIDAVRVGGQLCYRNLHIVDALDEVIDLEKSQSFLSFRVFLRQCGSYDKAGSASS